MSAVVLDASVLVEILSPDSSGEIARTLASQYTEWSAPEHVRLEVAHAVRRLVRSGSMEEPVGLKATQVLAELPIETVGSDVLLPRVWELRHTLTACDAAYVAAAEHLGAVLLSNDKAIWSAADTFGCAVIDPWQQS